MVDAAGVVVVVVGVVVVVVVGAMVVVGEAPVELDAADDPVVEVDGVVVEAALEPFEVEVVKVDAWWVDAPATAIPIPTAATVAVRPMATVARRIRTSASSLDRAASLRERGSAGGTMTAPFVRDPARAVGSWRWGNPT